MEAFTLDLKAEKLQADRGGPNKQVIYFFISLIPLRIEHFNDLDRLRNGGLKYFIDLLIFIDQFYAKFFVH